MILSTVNEGRGIGTSQVRSDFKKIKSFYGKLRNLFEGAIIGFQEIDEADSANEHAILREVFGKDYTLIAMEHHVPMAVSRKYKIVRTWSIKGSDGIPHVSPTRWLTVALIEYKKEQFAVINTHYAAGAFNKKTEKTQKARENAWHEHNVIHRELVKKFASKNITVFSVGDMNRTNMPPLHKDERKIMSGGIDDITVIEGSLKVQVKRKGSLKTNSDHDPDYIGVKLVPTKKKR